MDAIIFTKLPGYVMYPYLHCTVFKLNNYSPFILLFLCSVYFLD